ncbi:MAG: penicillin-binding protein [Chloroflexi bacterium 13_1_40CM_55_7]|nr:MAG: penicillin-binding protein [Acidobacteriales bacterium 13_2_20CM_2_55_5]OLC21981.1 MAG: penicillin-binding protein [Chloroflexi bacterium 13_1_40CM_55_7]OLD16808.1 MAG: penicillin-binding protein [Acidobacteriales bacterium 13_1_40CM_3_55_5]PYX16455.1 MAG: penicillin-binding protein [Acidobacteriota bacterium]
MKSLYQDLPVVQIAGRKLVGRLLIGLLVLVSALLGATAGLLLVYSTDLPQVEQLEHYRPGAITQLYDTQGRIIGSFALQRRVVASYDDYPPVLRDALISIEDKNFYRHWGINVWRIAGAAYRDLLSGGKMQGASTLTMQLARNLFLSPDRSWHRKIQEAMLAIQIERRFTKPQIFTLYANQIYLGHGVYGFEAASQFYFSKPAKQLTLDEAALLAGLPKSPSYYSPINHPDHAIKRRNLVINAMLEDGKITAGPATDGRNKPLELKLQHDSNSLAPYFTEDIRRYLENKYGSDQVHQGGLRVYTSLDMDLQRAANQAVLDGLAAYERRHGWKGHLENILSKTVTLDNYQHSDWDDEPQVNGYVHALVTAISPASAAIKFGRYTSAISQSEAVWTARKPQSILKVGDIVYVKVLSLGPKPKIRVSLEQDSGAQGALVALDNSTGEIKAMAGGRDFNLSKFNRATQALRQVGSSFKPYVYTAAIDQGAKPDDTIMDGPVTFQTASGPYVPHNYDEKFEGSITLRRALAQSRNIPALQLAQNLGIKNVIDYAHRFGITSNIPAYLPVALGAAEVTLLEQTSAYSVFPNDGVRVNPRYITKVTDYEGRVLEEDFAEVKDVISMNTARIMTSMLRDVVLHGTAISATVMKYPLAGKTGTTNNSTDAWFVGFSPSITCGVWMGFDEKKSLGPKETGAHAALPIWMDFMKIALAGKEPGEFAPPPELPPSPVGQKVDTPDLAPSEDETPH